jgi:hypothetical protein
MFRIVLSVSAEAAMLRSALLLLTALGIATATAPMPETPAPQEFRALATDTVQAGSPVLDPGVLRPYQLRRELTMTRGDSVRRFGRQSEVLTADTIGGRPVLLHVVTFDTPNALTVDSSWVDPVTLSPIRMQSSNQFRVVDLEFGTGTVRATTTPADSAPTTSEHPLAVRAFEWNMLPLALSSLPLRPGYTARIPVFSDRAGQVVWYSLRVAADTFLTRASGHRSPMWQIVARADSGGPDAQWWVSQRHHFVDQALVSEPGVSILYAREGL